MWHECALVDKPETPFGWHLRRWENNIKMDLEEINWKGMNWFSMTQYRGRGTRWRCDLRHCATSRKVVGSIPDGVGIFHWHNPFGFTMALGSTQPLTEYQEYFLVGKGGRCVGLTILPPSCADYLEIWDPQTPGTLRVCPGLEWDSLPFILPV